MIFSHNVNAMTDTTPQLLSYILEEKEKEVSTQFQQLNPNEYYIILFYYNTVINRFCALSVFTRFRKQYSQGQPYKIKALTRCSIWRFRGGENVENNL